MRAPFACGTPRDRSTRCAVRTGTDAPRRAGRKIFFEKLAKYIGRGIRNLIDRPDGAHCFRLHRDRVYYVREDQVPLRRLARACACRL